MNASFWSGRSVFLTGHTGFKGAWLALWLKAMGARVHGFALPPVTNPNLFSILDLERSIDSSTIGDVGDLEALTTALKSAGAEVVLHLAAQALVRPSYRFPVDTFRTNVMGTVHMMEAIRRIGGVTATVIVTTDKCYENREQIWSYRESDALGGRDPYSASKGAAEIAASSFARSYFGDQGSAPSCGAAATARAGNVIGGGDWSEDRLMPDLIAALGKGSSAQIRSPRAMRPWQHVLEPLSGYLQLAEQLAADPKQPFDSWNFGPDYDAEKSVLEVAKATCRLWGRPDSLDIAPDGGPHEASLLTLDNTKARRDLGWSPQLRLEQALSWLVEWHQAFNRGEDVRELTLRQIEDYWALFVKATEPSGM